MLTGLLFELKRETLIQRDSMVSQLFHGAALQHPQLPFLVSELWLQEQTNTAGWLGQDERGARWLGGPCVGLQCRRSTPIEENQACLRFKSTTKTRKKTGKTYLVCIYSFLLDVLKSGDIARLIEFQALGFVTHEALNWPEQVITLGVGDHLAIVVDENPSRL